MHQKTVYILHKNGAKSHYKALDYLLSENEITLKHREFSIVSKLFKSLKTLNGKLFAKQLVNLGFLLKLLFSKNHKVILGIAPYDSKLNSLLKVLKNHKIYYHTSWTYWDKSFHPKQKNNSKRVFERWQRFLEKDVNHIFAVTQKSKDQIIANYEVRENQVSIVYHAIETVFIEKQKSKKEPLSFVYFGRLVPQKGIEEILSFFAGQKKASLTIIGEGEQKSLVQLYAQKNENISYINHISNTIELVTQLSHYQYLVMNSKRTSKWEELFGIAIIESMAQGVIPIATDHSGPKEIITKDVGYLCKEGEITDVLSNIIDTNHFDQTMSEGAVKKAEQYIVQSICEKWKAILD